jgi:hypothetical protein
MPRTREARGAGKTKEAPAIERVRDSLGRLAERLHTAESARSGVIVFRLTGDGGGTYALERAPSEVRLQESAAEGAETPPLIEVMGDAETISAIIDGEKDAQKQFLTGRIRLRGDLRYLSDLAVELGILKTPL